MYTIAVIADSQIPDRPCRDLLYAIKQRGYNAKYIPISRISVVVDGETVELRIRDSKLQLDGVFLRSLGFLIDLDQFIRRVTVLKLIQESGTVVLNPLEGFLKSRSKLETIVELARHGIPVPRTVCTEDLYYAYLTCKELSEFVLKPIQGSRGFGAVKLSDPDVAFQIMKTLLSYKKPLYIQKYIPKPGRDIRVLVVDGEVFACMYRIAPDGSWKTNVAQGGRGVPCEKLDPELCELAIKATEVLGLVYAGVDIGEGPDGYVVFEVNGSPDWRELAQVTGKNPADRLVEAIIRRIKR